MNVSDLRVGMRRVDITVKVLEISEVREVTSRYDGKMHRVATAVVSDDTGSIKLALWDDNIDRVGVNYVIRIENGYVTTFMGEPQLNVGRYGTLTVLEEEEEQS
ncbi:MAG TPA: DNA-binding protein [Candidatus Bathyarchaeota archaeon]|nr:MAG: DNA-binding protein [Thermoplasmata archaeon]HDM26707.1 DNA-binding protein [Candidatus Bathyarchaeota archaeon]